ncbi:MAG TPA: ABC transporter ATP-binding protein [Armatimonadota bacterium]|jgi:ABC-2 type transport system ATP-binding protein
MQSAIELDHLTKVYRSLAGGKRTTALDDVSLSVAPGEVFGYLGSNGAGKTTTVKILLRLARPTHGTARLMGERPGGRIRHRIGYLPEAPYFPDFLTPVELLTFYARIFGLNGAARRQRIDHVLELVGIAGRRDSVLRTFSKGMTQRVGLAQALLNEPDILLLDEPTSGLDPLGRREIRDIILDLKEKGKTVFLNSHLLSEVELICDRVAILRRGKLMRLGTVDELVSRGGVEVVLRSNGVGLPAGLTALRCDKEDLEAGMARLIVERDDEVPSVLRAALDADVEVVSVNPQRETLEDLFVRIERGH